MRFKIWRVIEELIVLYPFLVLAGTIYVTTWKISFAAKVGVVLVLTFTIPILNWLVERKAQESETAGEEKKGDSHQISYPVRHTSLFFREQERALDDSARWPDMVTEVGNIYKKVPLSKVKAVDMEIDRTIEKYKFYL